ncbi:hypothetical protein AG1IA_09970 [Rhizoctonia solani AG-1 IA]|uniref:Uncharacterized protein n=1 Tax=Thanatephorus cucumeris (strain AG1-IA) TaxID=983506 RepID=L8WDF9_THACA|nr:hypothetical protein AG1IA_09970 [Rhizoctonia solani AG-1 IA]
MTVFMLFNIRYISSLGLSANVSSTLFLMLYTYWGIQTWSFPPCPSNSLTVFVLFGRSMPATQPGLRTFALMVFGMIGVVALGSLILLVDWIRKVWSHGGEAVARKMELWMNSKRQKYGIRASPFSTCHPTHMHRKLSRLSLLSFPIIIYLLVTTEQLVARNQSAHNLTNLDEWTFGQTIAVLMLLLLLVETGLCAWKERKWTRRMEWRARARSGGKARGQHRGRGVPLPFAD